MDTKISPRKGRPGTNPPTELMKLHGQPPQKGRPGLISIYKSSSARGIYILSIPMVLAVFFAFILPYGASFLNAFRGEGEISVWNNTALFRITLFTFKQAFFSVLVSLAIGLPGAWLLGCGKSRFIPLLRSLTAIPFAMPSILVVLGFVLFFGNSGWLNRFIAVFPGAGPLRILYKPEAIILAHGFFNFPLVVRLAGDGLARARNAYAPAAASLGASPFMTAVTVILPLAVPAIMSAVLLVFLYCFTSFAVVLVLGGGPASTTLPVEIFRQARVFLNYRNAGVLAFLETLIAVSVFLCYVFFVKKSGRAETDIQERFSEEKRTCLAHNSQRITAHVSAGGIVKAVYCLAAAVFILGPVISIIAESLLYTPSRSSAQAISLRWWLSLGESCLPALLRSLLLAFFSASFACALAILAAGSLKLLENRDSGKGRAASTAWVNLVRFFAAAPLISSGIVLGLGWLVVYGKVRSPQALVMLHAIIALPFAFSSISEGFRSLPANVLNAAAVSGAGPLRGLVTTALPLSLKRIRSAWGFAAALSMGELNAVMMLGMDNWETLPLYIYRAAEAYRYGAACAAGTLLILCFAAGFLLSEGGRSGYGS